MPAPAALEGRDCKLIHIQWEKTNMKWNEMFSAAAKMCSKTTEHWWMKAKQKVLMLLLSINPFKKSEIGIDCSFKKELWRVI